MNSKLIGLIYTNFASQRQGITEDKSTEGPTGEGIEKIRKLP